MLQFESGFYYIWAKSIHTSGNIWMKVTQRYVGGHFRSLSLSSRTMLTLFAMSNQHISELYI